MQRNHTLPPPTLQAQTNKAPFRCDGCREMRLGSRHKCDLRDYDLHLQCALPSPTIYHSFYIKCSFNFLSHPPGTKPRIWNACRSDLKGFVYHCHQCGFGLQPCCAKLPMEISERRGCSCTGKYDLSATSVVREGKLEL